MFVLDIYNLSSMAKQNMAYRILGKNFSWRPKFLQQPMSNYMFIVNVNNFTYYYVTQNNIHVQ